MSIITELDWENDSGFKPLKKKLAELKQNAQKFSLTCCAMTFEWIRWSMVFPGSIYGLKEINKKPDYGILEDVTYFERTKCLAKGSTPVPGLKVNPATLLTGLYETWQDDWQRIQHKRCTRFLIEKISDFAPKAGLGAAIKARDKGSYSIILLTDTQHEWLALALDRDKASKRIFDPSRGQIFSQKSEELAEEVLKRHPTMTHFAVAEVSKIDEDGGWTKDQEKRSERLIKQAFEYLAENDMKNIKRAGVHAKDGVVEFLKEFGKDALLGLIPGVGMSLSVTRQIDAMIDAAFAEATLETASQSGNAKRPYNYLSNLYSKILKKKAKEEETKLFVKYYAHLAVMAGGSIGGMAAGMAGAEALGEGVSEVIKTGAEKGIEKAVDWGADLLLDEILALFHVDIATKEKLLDKIKPGPLAWAIYLSGAPRAPRRPTDEIENTRLALRAVLGMPYFETRQVPSNDNWYTLSSNKTAVVTPADVCNLLGDENGDLAINSSDTTGNFNKVASFCDCGEVDSAYDGYTRPKELPKQVPRHHLAYLEIILVGLGQKKCLSKHIFQLK